MAEFILLNAASTYPPSSQSQGAVLGDEIKAVSVEDKEAFSIGRDVKRLLDDLDAVETGSAVLTEDPIMIASNVNYTRSLSRSIPKGQENGVVDRLPHSPKSEPVVKDVSNQIEGLRLV